MKPSYHQIDSPIGTLTLTADADTLTGVYMESEKHPVAELLKTHTHSPDSLRDATTQLTDFFRGSRTTFNLPLAPRGTDFQQRVWKLLLSIPFGETWSYRALAVALGDPNASRAVGLANGRNPISIIIPCHRVIGSAGSLTGYGGGLPRKKWLLEFEAAHAHSALPFS